MNLTITDKAKTKLQQYNVGKNRILRISITPGGCSGMSYNATVEDKIIEGDDIVYQDEQVTVTADKRSSLFLDGLHIDYSDDLIQAGFRLTNPNASSACACGSSFSM